MTKYLILFNSSQSAKETMVKSTPEEMKAGMEAWMKWKDEVDKMAKFEWGLPLQSVGRVTPTGMTESSNQANGYCIIETDSKDAVMKLLQSHPHFKSPDSTIDVLEMIPMPGM